MGRGLLTCGGQALWIDLKCSAGQGGDAELLSRRDAWHPRPARYGALTDT